MIGFTELAILYRAMQADPDNFVKRCAYFEALATVQTADYNAMSEKNAALVEYIAQLEAELKQVTL